MTKTFELKNRWEDLVVTPHIENTNYSYLYFDKNEQQLDNFGTNKEDFKEKFKPEEKIINKVSIIGGMKIDYSDYIVYEISEPKELTEFELLEINKEKQNIIDKIIIKSTQPLNVDSKKAIDFVLYVLKNELDFNDILMIHRIEEFILNNSIQIEKFCK